MKTDYEEHAAEAQALLDNAEESDYGSDEERYMLAAAQVHATLALAAATRANGVVTVREDRP
jgi:hypothetical protein